MQSKINDFTRRYLDKGRVIHWNTVKFTGTSKEHQDMVYEICWYLYKNNIPFCTEAKFSSGYEPDILAPTHVKPIIEVRHSEGDKQTMSKFKRIPEELHNEIILVDVGKEFEEKMIL